MPPLSESERDVMLNSATEMPRTGAYWDSFEEGIYLCRQCGAPLYRSSDKFKCHCGWPSFDQALPEAVERHPDPDGHRVEIVCANCKAHLGHVFEGEGLTSKNTRHCVNSLSLFFIPTESAIFAGGCFWGIEDFFSSTEGVINVLSGYTGGTTQNPTYREVCNGDTGHAEAILIDFDPSVVSYESLLRLFFEIHDPTQLNRQGPDVGSQYRSAIFYLNDDQKKTAEKMIQYLKGKGENVATELNPATTFYPAEEYHQKYFEKHPEMNASACHRSRKRIWA